MFSEFPSRLRHELKTLITPGPRMIDELECVLSVLFAIYLAHLLGAKLISWAAFSAFVLMRGEISETLLRGFLRIVGTILGASLALAVVPYAVEWFPATVMAAAIVGAFALYGTLTAKRAYAWLLFGLTFEMILLDKVEHPELNTTFFAITRLLEVLAGTIACVTVSLLSSLTARKLWPASSAAPPARLGWDRSAARHAAQAGVALAMLPILHSLFQIPELQQAGITIMAVMIVPAAAIGSSGLSPVSRRLYHRAIGCSAGGILAAMILFIAQGSAPILIAGTCLGIIIGRHIENGSTKANYLGLQFTLAILASLVPDDYSNASIDPALHRLTSIFIGMALLVPVLLAWHLIASTRKPAAPEALSQISE